jgi:hypothetical protein
VSPAPAKRTHTSPRREIAIGVVLVGLYLVVAAFSAGRRDIAHNNAQSLLALERWLRVNIEAVTA